jgi:hypothetical protein
MPAPADTVRQRMATAQHRAIRLGLSIAAVITIATPVKLAGQAPEHATFRVVENGAPIGSATISVSREAEGWRVESTSHVGGSIGLDVRRLDITYDPEWRMRFLSMEIAWRQETRVIHVATQGLRARTDVVVPDREVTFRTQWISPGTIALPDEVFGAYQALAARVEALVPGDDIPLLLTPGSEVHASVDATRVEELRTTSGSIRVRHVSLLVIRDIATPIEIWVSQGALLKVELPLDHLSAIRSDISD